MKTFQQYLETTVDEKTHQIKDTPLYDFLHWAKEDEKFSQFIDKIKNNPKKRIDSFQSYGPTGSLLLYWIPEFKDADRLEIDFERGGRPLARSQRERIYNYLIQKISNKN